MTTTEKTILTIAATIKAPVQLVWQLWTSPEHITQWNQASDEWYTPKAESDLQPGGQFSYRMEAKDGSMGFDFGGTYDTIQQNVKLEYTLDDGRKVTVSFNAKNNETEVVETFEAEETNPIEMQQAGWQAILDNFKSYAEKVATKPS